MIEVLVESALDSPGLFEGPFEEVFENLLCRQPNDCPDSVRHTVAAL